MDTKEYIESGVLELYVYGLLSDAENEEVNLLADQYPEIKAEIISIEKSIVNISTSFSPFLSVENFEKIKTKLELKHAKVVNLHAQSDWKRNLSWAAAAVFLLGFGYQYFLASSKEQQLASAQKQKKELEATLASNTTKIQKYKSNLAVLQDDRNKVIPLSGQAASPNSSAKIYWNQTTQEVFVDASRLPVPPKGMVYQVWSLKLKPALSPTSIGIISDFSEESTSIFAVNSTTDAEAFGITLEPAGGSASPTMAQLYTLGKV
ncbi:MAG: anti-sigma factor [Saprospiraceae bacterium]